MEKLIGPDGDPSEFWNRVKTNVIAGKIRLLFVSDEIPPELRRIVEFLNQQMDPAEVLAIEIRQYIGGRLKTMVPRVIGQTQEAKDRKSPTVGKQWNEISFFDELAKHITPEDSETVRKIFDWTKKNTNGINWGKGLVTGSFVPTYDTSRGVHYQLFAVFTSGNIQIYFGVYKNRPEFKEDSKRIELLDKLNSIAGVNIPPDGINRYPNFPISALKNEQALKLFFETYEWFLDVIK